MVRIEEWIIEHRWFLIALALVAVSIGWMQLRVYKEKRDFERYMQRGNSNEKRNE